MAEFNQYQLLSYEIEAGKEKELMEKVEMILKESLSLTKLKQVQVLAGDDFEGPAGEEQPKFKVFTLIPTEDGQKALPDPWDPDDPVLKQTLRDNLIVHSQFE